MCHESIHASAPDLPHQGGERAGNQGSTPLREPHAPVPLVQALRLPNTREGVQHPAVPAAPAGQRPPRQQTQSGRLRLTQRLR